jgi:RHS repeat-associated protein
VDGSDLAIFSSDFGRTDCPGEEIYYYHNDHLGTPQKMTDVNGAVVWSADYRPFGQADVTVNTVVNNFRFPGQYWDGETGLHYNWHRYYDPGIGRYLRADPIGLDGGINVYIYTQNNATNEVDPRGLKVEVCERPVDIDWVPSWSPNHRWIRTSSKEAGMGPEGCGDLGYTSPYYAPNTEICDHSGQGDKPGSKCETKKCIDETCVNNELIIGKSLGKWSLTNNCWFFVRSVLRKCPDTTSPECCKD